jgi:hypothetical protein
MQAWSCHVEANRHTWPACIKHLNMRLAALNVKGQMFLACLNKPATQVQRCYHLLFSQHPAPYLQAQEARLLLQLSLAAHPVLQKVKHQLLANPEPAAVVNAAGQPSQKGQGAGGLVCRTNMQ